MSSPPRARWFATGNTATGFVAVGNVVTGVFAFGNVARGVVAVGNLAVGVIAIGNVGFGVIAGGGATIGIGMFALAGVAAVPVLGGFGGLETLTDASMLFGLLPIALWAVAGLVGRGRLPAAPTPTLVPLSAVAQGAVEQGWVLARVRAIVGGRVRVAVERSPVELELTAAAREALAVHPRGRWLLLLDREERLADDAQGYRDAPTEQRVLCCLQAQPVPVVPLWAESSGVQYVLGLAWRIGAVVGLAAWLIAHFVG